MGTDMSYLGGGKDILDGLSNLGTDTITLNQTDEEVALSTL
jgi:hypothetical protein